MATSYCVMTFVCFGTVVLEPESDAETLAGPDGRCAFVLDLVLDEVQPALPLVVGGFQRRVIVFE